MIYPNTIGKPIEKIFDIPDIIVAFIIIYIRFCWYL